MAKFLEFEGKNIDKAVKKASKKLKVNEDDLKYEVITYGSTGIFGFGKSKKAKIKIDLDQKNHQNGIQETLDETQKEIKASIRSLIDETFKIKSKDEDRPDEDQIDENIEVSIKIGKEALTRILDAITDDTIIKVDNNHGDHIKFEISGGNTAVLIGKHGQTLEAIQTIVEKIVNKNIEKRIRLSIDVEGYLEKRKSNLRKHAERLAEKCKRIGKPVTLGMMNAHDRRIVHITLKQDKKVRTQSMGEGFMRKLVIFPKKNYHPKRKAKK